MTSLFRHNNLLASLLVFAYLLIGAGMGNALLLCQESEAAAHLEYMLSGSCQDDCQAEDGRAGGGCTRSVRAWSATDCLDTPVSLSHVSARDKDLSADSVVSDGVAVSLDDARNYPATELKILRLVAQPPPPLILAVLRTVVLLT